MDKSEFDMNIKIVVLEIHDLIDKMVQEKDPIKIKMIDKRIDKMEEIKSDLISKYLGKGFNLMINIIHRTRSKFFFLVKNPPKQSNFNTFGKFLL